MLPGPGSISWRVNREAALLLGGGRALLMQLAHPKVAAGVADHSDFEHNALGRLNRTLELSLALTFGTRDEIRAAAARINGTHRRVTGPNYRALDPDLLLWVDATLIDSALLTYRTFVGPLDRAGAERYYQEAKEIGGLLGIPRRSYPPTLADFEAYRDGMLAGPVSPDATGLRLARLVLRPRIGLIPAAALAPFDAITAGLLPDPLRRAYGLAWGRPSQALFRVAAAVLPPILRATPRWLRVVPPARRAEQRTNATYPAAT